MRETGPSQRHHFTNSCKQIPNNDDGITTALAAIIASFDLYKYTWQ
jgi:hypothetical protein